MRLWTRVLEPALGLAAAALLALLIVPWTEKPLPLVAAKARANVPARQAEALAGPRALAPDAILPLFVGRAVPKPAPVAPPAPQPAPVAQPAPKVPAAAPWLRYMGRSTAPDGTSSVYLKDTRTGKVLRAAQGVALGGWTLVSEDDAGLVLANGEDLYAVNKR